MCYIKSMKSFYASNDLVVNFKDMILIQFPFSIHVWLQVNRVFK